MARPYGMESPARKNPNAGIGEYHTAMGFPSFSGSIRLLLCGLALLTLTGASAAPPADHLQTLSRYLAGNFSSAEQAAQDKRYFPVMLHTVPVWTGRSDGPWFFEEEALADAPDFPHRQCVYQLAAQDHATLILRVFQLPASFGLESAWHDAATRFEQLTPSDLKPLDGGTIFFHQQSDGSFAGSTEGKGYASDVQGASYATINLVVAEDRAIRWDRGYAASGQQVWGPLPGGYIFKKLPSPSE